MHKTLVYNKRMYILKRVVLGLQRGSVTIAERFLEEAEKRKQEVDFINFPDYLIEIIQKS